jgi:GGDEF domain-containing protein
VPRALSLVVPEGLIVIVAIALALFGASITGFAQVAEWLPWLIFLPGAAIAWGFRRGRLLAGLLALLPWWWWVARAHDAPWQLPLIGIAAVTLVAVGWSRERGVGGWYFPLLLLSVSWATTWIAGGWSIPTAPTLPLWVVGVAAFALVIASLLRADGVAQGSLWALVSTWAVLTVPERAGELILVAGGAGALVAGALESIFAAAYRDVLTGLPSRRALDERLDGLPAGVVVAMLDVDHFKQFNDTYGHDTGDQVLRMVAWRLAEVADGEAFRYGGEEFTLIFPSLSLADATKRLENARLAIAANRFTLRSDDRPKGKQGKDRRNGGGQRHGLSVTVSIGVALRGEKEHALALLKRADEALYKAKEGGRDRVIAAR